LSERGATLSAADRAELAAIARRSLVAAVRGAPPPPVAPLSPRLLAPGASFVTLTAGGGLRGCIGTLAPRRSLAADVAANARAAALEDARFAPVGESELAGLELEISVLSPPEPLPVASRAELVARLRPGVDGLVLLDGWHRATFLPAVWEQLPEPEAFLSHLERKAGLPPGHWSPTVRVERYEVEAFDAGPALEPTSGSG